MNTFDKLVMFSMAVSDMVEAKDFYAEKLGFKITTQWSMNESRHLTTSKHDCYMEAFRPPNRKNVGSSATCGQTNQLAQQIVRATMQQVSPTNSKKGQSKKVALKHSFDQGSARSARFQ